MNFDLSLSLGNTEVWYKSVESNTGSPIFEQELEFFHNVWTSKSCEKLLWESTVLQCIFDKKECDARNHKHFEDREEVHEKNTTGDPIRNSTFFFNAIIMNWTRLLISSKIEASFMLPFVIKPPSLLYLIAALSGHITHQASLTFGIKNCTESTKWKQADNNLHKRKPCAIRFAFHLFPQFNFPVFSLLYSKIPNIRTCPIANFKMVIWGNFWGTLGSFLRSFFDIILR